MSRRYRQNSITIDLDAFIGEIDDESLIDEVRSRKLIVGGDADALPEDLLQEAYQELVRGRALEARSILERLLHPKWKSAAAAQAALDLVKKSA